MFDSVTFKFLNSIKAPLFWPGNLNKGSLLGYSPEGRAIKAEVTGSGDKTLLAYGYPHPHEPIGSAALQFLKEFAKTSPDILNDWRIVTINCADPDQVARQKWLADKSIESYLAGVWQTANTGYDVDYGFPINYLNRRQDVNALGRCVNINQCRHGCKGLEDCLYLELSPKPLAESLAILEALRKYQPDLVVSMHNMHASGDYTFVHLEEPVKVFRDLALIPELFGSRRHLGESPDPGEKWFNQPDLFHDYGFEHTNEELQKRNDYSAESIYHGNASIAMLLDSEFPLTQFMTPETGMFSCVNFSDTTLTSWSRKELADKIMLERKRFLDKANQIWDKVDQSIPHPYLLEHKLGGFYLDLDEGEYSGLATVAQAETFLTTWRIETALSVSNLSNYLISTGQDNSEIVALQKEFIKNINPASRMQSDWATGIKSQLARILYMLKNGQSR